MELFTGDRRNFPQHVAPFPDSLASPAAIHWPEEPPTINHRPNLPPQKLRPIRYNSRSPAYSQSAAAEEDPMEFTEVVEFLQNQPCLVNGESSEYFVPPIKSDSAEIRDFGGGENHERNVLKDRVLEELSSFSSGSGVNGSSASVKEPANRKRKRKARKIEMFVENLVVKVLEKQESLQKELIEKIETRDKERIVKEEEWRRQEMERLKRDEEARIQEMSRNLTLISIIRNFLGHETELPLTKPSTSLPSTISSMEDSGGKNRSEDQIQREVNNESDPLTNWQVLKLQSSGDANRVMKDIETKFDPRRRWPEAEVQALIMLRRALDGESHAPGLKCPLWDEISIRMHDMGYNRSAKKCKEKWVNINRYCRKSKEIGKKCTNFQELSMLYGTGHPIAGDTSNHANNENGI